MREESTKGYQLDWLTIIVYIGLVSIGLTNIYSVNYSEDGVMGLSSPAIKQLIFIIISLSIAIIILFIDYLFFSSSFVFVIYLTCIFALILVLLVGREVGGAKAWLDLPFSLKLQPSEFTKIAISLLLAKIINEKNMQSKIKIEHWIKSAAIVIIPGILIMLQPDLGTLIIFLAFLFVGFREGMSPLILTLGFSLVIIFILTLLFGEQLRILQFLFFFGGVISLFIGKNKKNISHVIAKIFITVLVLISTFGVNFVFQNILKPHHRNRIQVLFDSSIDPRGIGYNINQAKIAIGAGGLLGQGYLQGIQTRGKFVPEQNTDFIFCTIGEEHGFVGSILTILLFVMLIYRILMMAERQKTVFGRVYGYCAACLIFLHFTINIGMVLALFPVVGIPLPFISYGGSSLISFTILIFIIISIDAHRGQMLNR